MKTFPCTLRVSLYCALILSSRIAAQAQEIRVEHNVLASPIGWTSWYETHVDPSNAANRIVCGSRWDAKDNASYGFVSTSTDSGLTWKETLLDKDSVWVSEESCAYGTNGIAYFIADASKVIDGELHHELGTTNIYVSHDSGKTWKLGIQTGWTDYSAPVVDTALGPNQNRLYIYFNNLATFYSSVGQKDAEDAELKSSTGTRIGMISYKDGDAKVAGPFTSEAMAKENYHGSYPVPSMLMKDGSIVTIYTAKRRADTGREFMVNSVRTSADRTSLDAPVKLVDSLDTSADDSNTPCGGYYLDSAATYDPVHDRLYFLYSDVRAGRTGKPACHLFLVTSTDDARTWSKPQQVYTTVMDSGQEYAGPAIAVNKDGLIAMLWEKTYRSGCWMFATSADDGKTLSHATPLGSCTTAEDKPSRLNTNYLWDSIFQADPKRPNDTARINLRNTRNGGAPHEDGIGVTPDGTFHPVWIDAGSGEGELRTAAIHVTPVATLIANATTGLTDVTSKLVILYGGDQFYDPKTKLITLDVVIKNNSDQPLTGPFKLTVPSLYKDYGFSEIANADNKVSGPGAVWDIGGSVPGGTLAPGATSKPFALKFRYTIDESTPRDSDDILGLNMKVFAGK